MKNVKSIVSVCLAVALFALLLAACARSTEQGTAPAAPGDEKKPVVLSFIHFYMGGYAAPMEKLEELYNKENPHVTFAMTSAEDYFAVLNSRLAAGDVPDLYASPAFASSHEYADRSEDLSNEPFWDEINPASYSSIEFEGKKMAVPFQTQAWGLVYNKEVFEKAGITTLPSTLSELADAAEQLKAAGIVPFATPLRDPGAIWQMLLFPLFSIEDNAEEIYNDVISKKIKLKDQPFMKKITDFATLVLNNSQDKPFDTDSPAANALVAQGKAAMMTTGDWAEPEMKQINPDVKIAFMPMPFSDDPKDGRIFSQTGIVLHVGKGAKHVQEAKDFLNWLVTSQSSKDWMSNDMLMTSDINGVSPASGDLPLSVVEISKNDPDKVALWGTNLFPASLSFDTINDEFAGGRITAEQWIDEMSKIFEEYVPAQ